ncbi:MAG: radical SAM protein [Candidatus Riflebacteria bacterium]|nr:radical SAM protein [Candidatus Riflebacteria bacterium]
MTSNSSVPVRPLSLLAWETTRACPLSCRHCRASAVCERGPDELTTEEGKKLLLEAAKLGPRVIAILSGGEPLLRPDLEELAAAGTAAGMTVVVSGNDGDLFTDARIASLKTAGVRRFSFSIHNATEAGHDAFTGRPGTLKGAIAAFGRLKAAGMGFQINTTVLPENQDQLDRLFARVQEWGASAWHLFFTVPTGRALELGGSELDPASTEHVLRWIADAEDSGKIPMKVTCAPQYARIRAQRAASGAPASAKPSATGHPHGHGHGSGHPQNQGRGCMAGDGFAFVSSTGDVKPCGYFDLIAGNVRQTPFDEIYLNSPLLSKVRDIEHLSGPCGECGFRNRCGGCRARAYARTGDPLATDESCALAKARSRETSR